MVAAELDLAWWSTVFEEILRRDPAMAAYDGAALSRLVAEFRALDRRHLEDRALLHVAAFRETLRQRLRRSDEQTQALFAEIVEDRFTSLRSAVERYPEVTRHLRPCLVVGPMLVPHVLPATRTEDLLILDAAGHLPTELVVGALARARQVLVVADTRCATGTAVPQLAEVLPQRRAAGRRVASPTPDRAARRHGYGATLTAMPLPSTTGLLQLDLVDGSGMPGADGSVPTTHAEVDHVVNLVVEHAMTRPRESLAVVALSVEHADRVREAVLAQVRSDPAVVPFFDAHVREPFAVLDLSATEGLHRDAVIVSVGFGRTPHGRVLHRFGSLMDDGAETRLVEVLGAPRRRLRVVSCFAAADLDPERLSARGPALLRDLLAAAAEPESAQRPARPRADGYRPARARPGRTVVADGADGVARPRRAGRSIGAARGGPPRSAGRDARRRAHRRRRLPRRAERAGARSAGGRAARAAGLDVVQVWSAAAFLDPQSEADAVAQAVVDAYAARMRRRQAAPRPVPTPAASPEAQGEVRRRSRGRPRRCRVGRGGSDLARRGRGAGRARGGPGVGRAVERAGPGARRGGHRRGGAGRGAPGRGPTCRSGCR